MGIEPPYIGLYGVWSMVGIEVRGMAEAGCYWGVVWVGQWGYWSGWLEVQGISNPDCNTLLRQNPARLNPEEPCPMTVPTPHQGLRGLSFGTISYASLSVITRMTAPNDFQGRRQKVVKRLHSGTQRRFLASTEA